MSHLSSNVKATLGSGLPQTASAGVKIGLPAQMNPTASNPSIAVRTVNSSISDAGLTGHVMLNTSNPSVSASGLPTSATPVVVIRSITGTTGGTVSNVVASPLPSTVKIATVPISNSIASSTTCSPAGSIGQPVRLTTVVPTAVPVIRSTAVVTSITRPTGNALVPLKTGPPTSVAAATCASPLKLPLVKESVSPVAKTSLRQGTSGSTSSPVQQRHVIREMQVRVPNRPDKRFSVLRFHSADRLDLSSGLEVFMQRENNLRQFRSANSISDTPERGGAGSEFGRDAKEEARLRRFGVVRESYRPDDQPWLMTVGKGKSGRRRFRGVREGSVSDNVQYFVFCQCKDGNFDAYPVHSWYKMKPEINYRFLRDEEAEMEYNRMHKTMNLFNVMIKRKLSEGDEAGVVTVGREIDKELKYLSVATDSKQDAESALPPGRPSKQKGAGDRKSTTTSRKLKLTDLEELDMANSDADEEEDDEDDDEVNGGAGDVGGAPGASGEDATGGGETDGDAGEAGGRLARSRKLQMQKAMRKKMAAAARVSRMRRCVKKRKKIQLNMGSSSDDDDPMDEAQDDSELDDHEGDEVDYMTNSSSDEEKLSEEERHRIYEETGVDEEVGLKTLLTDLSSEEEAEDAGVSKVEEDTDVKPDVDGLPTDLPEDSNQALLDRVKNEEPHEGRRGAPNEAAPGLDTERHSSAATRRHRRKHRRKRKLKQKGGDDDEDHLSSSSSSSPDGGGGVGGSSSSSSVDGGDSSVYTSSSSSSEPSSSDSEPDGQVTKFGSSPDKKHCLLQKLSDSIHGATPAVATTSGMDAALEGRLGVKRQPPEGADGAGDLSASCDQPTAKKGRLDSSAEGTSSTLPAASSSVGADSELKNTVRKYLMRKPITVTELLKKIRLRKLVGKNENPQTALANVLRQLRPIKQIINGQHALSLKH